MIYVTVTYVINFLLGEYMVHQICWPLATQIYANRNRRTPNSTVQPRLVPWHYKETNIAPEIAVQTVPKITIYLRGGTWIPTRFIPIQIYIYIYIYTNTRSSLSVPPAGYTPKNATIQHPEINLTKILDEHQTSVHDPTLGAHRTLQ